MKNKGTASLGRGEEEHRIDCRPFLKWVGGKTQLLPELLKRVPPRESIKVYHEPFIGGGALFFAMQPTKAILSDVNHELINAYTVVRDSVAGLLRDLKKHEHSAEYYYRIREVDLQLSYKKWSRVRRASRIIYLNKTCFNGLFRVNSKGHFNVPFGRYVNPNFVDKSNLFACSKVLRSAAIQLAEFDTVVERTAKGDFVYFDPPYVPVSQTASFTSYSASGFTLKHQEALFEVCCALDAAGVRFMLSNSSVPFVKKLYRRFNVEQILASRMVNSKADKRGKIKEVLITNY